MSRAYTQEKLGIVQGSLVSPEVYPSAHTPEEEQQFQRLVKELQPIMMQAVQQTIEVYLEEQYDVHEGDILQFVRNEFYPYIDRRFYGASYAPGQGINGSALGNYVISVLIGDTPQGLKFSGTYNRELQVSYDEGIELDGSAIEAKCNADAAVGKDGDGIKVVLSDNVETGSGGGSGGLSFDGSNGLRVDPEDFLKIS